MAFCTNCGNQVADGVKFCLKCGTPAVAPAAQENGQAQSQTTQQPQPQAGQEWKQPQQDNVENKFAATMNSTADTTAEFDPKDIEQNKVMALLSYFGILVLIPLFGAKELPLIGKYKILK